MMISKQLHDFILTYWVYDKIYKNESIHLINLEAEINKFKQDLEIVELQDSSSSTEIVALIKVLGDAGIDSNEFFLEQLNKIAQKMGDNDIYHLETIEILKEKAALLITEVKKIFQIIKMMSDLNEAEKYFLLLDKIQVLLAGFVFRNGLEVDKNTRIFVHDFDRLDDYDTRLHLFGKIKNNVYDF